MSGASFLISKSMLVAAGLLPLLLAGCGFANQGPLAVAVIDDVIDGRAAPTGTAASLIRSATAEGLVGLDAEGHVVPALADRWVVTDSGRTYIFRLRDRNGPNGRPLAAEEVAGLLRRALAAQAATPLGRNLAVVEQVRVMASRVVELDLSAPMPNLLTVLARPELGLLWRGRGAGPMVAKRGKSAQSTVLQLLPPEQRGEPVDPEFADHTRTLELVRLPAQTAVDRFNAGKLDLVLGGTVDDLPLAIAGRFTRGNAQIDPVVGLYGLRVENADGFLESSPNREALALAIDRQQFVAGFAIGGWTPTTRLVAPQLPDDNGTIGERFEGLSPEARRAIAAGRVRQWQQANGRLPVLRVALPGGPGSRLLLDRLRADWGAIGVGVRAVGATAPADLRLVDAAAAYFTAGWFLDQFACLPGRKLCSREADADRERARFATTPDERAELLAQAEADLTRLNVFIPLARPMRWSMVRSGTTGFALNPLGWHPLPSLAMLAR